MRDFQLLEQIADDLSVAHGDLLLVKQTSSFGEGSLMKVRPLFYGGVDAYISDGSAGFKKGEKFEGVRVFHFMESDHEYGAVNEEHSIFFDARKGLFLPFNYEGEKYEYALLLKRQEVLFGSLQSRPRLPDPFFGELPEHFSDD